jgi:hypothetical protein
MSHVAKAANSRVAGIKVYFMVLKIFRRLIEAFGLVESSGAGVA